MSSGVNGRLAQLVRAPALQAGGHRFESYSAHHFFISRVATIRNWSVESQRLNEAEKLLSD